MEQLGPLSLSEAIGEAEEHPNVGVKVDDELLGGMSGEVYHDGEKITLVVHGKRPQNTGSLLIGTGHGEGPGQIIWSAGNEADGSG